MKRILILTETFAGYGHYQAALALKKGIEMILPKVEAKIICTLPLISKKLENLLGTCYLQILQHTPKMWGTLYQADARYSLPIRQLLKHLLKPTLLSIIKSFRPNLIICTHALCLSTCAMLKSQKHFSYYLGAVITDFDIHPYWLESGVDFYLLSHFQLKQKLETFLSTHAYDTGIPIDPTFATSQKAPIQIRQKLGWALDRLTILIMGGGIGLGPYPQIVSTLIPVISHYPIQLVTISGKNELLFYKLKQQFQHPYVYHYGFVQNIPEFMAGADLIISKPGGLTCSEALASSLPILICKPLPGQEEKNSHYLVQAKVAIRQDCIAHLPKEIIRLTKFPSILSEMKKRAQTIAKPYSAIHAAKALSQYL